MHLFMCVCMRACVRACVCAWGRACACVYARACVILKNVGGELSFIFVQFRNLDLLLLLYQMLHNALNYSSGHSSFF